MGTELVARSLRVLLVAPCWLWLWVFGELLIPTLPSLSGSFSRLGSLFGPPKQYGTLIKKRTLKGSLL